MLSSKFFLLLITFTTNLDPDNTDGDEILKEISEIFICHLGSSHYAVTHMRNKNSNIQGRSPNVVKVIFYSIRKCS